MNQWEKKFCTNICEEVNYRMGMWPIVSLSLIFEIFLFETKFFSMVVLSPGLVAWSCATYFKPVLSNPGLKPILCPYSNAESSMEISLQCLNISSPCSRMPKREQPLSKEGFWLCLPESCSLAPLFAFLHLQQAPGAVSIVLSYTRILRPVLL